MKSQISIKVVADQDDACADNLISVSIIWRGLLRRAIYLFGLQKASHSRPASDAAEDSRE